MFSFDIEKFANKALMKAAVNSAQITEETFTKSVEYSPSPSNPGEMAKGLLANQWYPAINGNTDSTVGSGTDSTGSGSLARIKAIVNSSEFFMKDNIFTLTNSLSYAYRAENLGWPANDSPTGWHWTGRVGPYKMVQKSIDYVKVKYS